MSTDRDPVGEPVMGRVGESARPGPPFEGGETTAVVPPPPRFPPWALEAEWPPSIRSLTKSYLILKAIVIVFSNEH